ncbi:MAG: hypothetical protein ABSH10_06440 [Phycisphaerae bacterium]
MRLAMIIIALAAMAVGLVHIRHAEVVARHDSQEYQLQQVKLRRQLWDQQIALSYLTTPAEVRKRSEEMSLGLVEKNGTVAKMASKANPTTHKAAPAAKQP